MLLGMGVIWTALITVLRSWPQVGERTITFWTEVADGSEGAQAAWGTIWNYLGWRL